MREGAAGNARRGIPRARVPTYRDDPGRKLRGRAFVAGGRIEMGGRVEDAGF